MLSSSPISFFKYFQVISGQSVKLQLFNSNVKSVLLYGSQTWKTSKSMLRKVQAFINKCLRRILRIRRPEKIRNEELWERTGQEPVKSVISRRKWSWIGHTLRKPKDNITKQALRCNPSGKRSRRRPKHTWRRGMEAEMAAKGYNFQWTGKVGPKSCPMETHCWWPMLHVGVKGDDDDDDDDDDYH